MSRLSLDSVEWKEFKFNDIFNKIQRGRRLTKGNQIDGHTPYVSSTAMNNGVDNFIANEENVRIFEECLTIANSGSVGACFYHSYKFVASDHVTSLKLKGGNKYIYLFMSTIVERLEEKYSFNREINDKRINQEKIILPIDENGSPNWKFMEHYVKQEQKEQAQKLVDYYKSRLLKCGFELMGLENVEWKEFILSDLFDIQIGKSIDGNKIQGNMGRTPYVTRKVTDNGYDNFIDDYPKEFLFTDVPVITIGNETAKPFVQVNPFYTSTKVNILKPKEQLKKEELLFLSMSLEKVCDRYSYSFTANSTRLKRQIILLPVYDNGKPHWEYMHQFIKKIEIENLSKVLEYIYKLAISMGSSRYSVSKVDWKEFSIEDIADIKSGKDIYQRERIDGSTPYITATSGNNGIGYFVNNTNATLEENCISVNRNGSVGYSFYHPYKALYGNDTRKLIPRIKDKYVSLFITASITSQKEKYGYGYKMGTGRIKRQKVLLPVDNKGKINYDYMKKFMLIQEIKECYKIIDYLIYS